MPGLKTTVSIDRDNLVNALDLLVVSSTSDVVDFALERLVRSKRLIRDLRGYLACPPTADELLLGELAVGFDLDDDVDYDALYGEREHGR